MAESAPNVDLPDTEDFRHALTTLVTKVNGFVYAGARLDAVVDTIKELRRDPELAEQLLTLTEGGQR